ncbi:PucR family transcriptional regulator [Lysinibacillus sp. LZ02]|uniref:PucR family transcriptional regulator n=1 Tax=Lysinibacillus sp. LZ02 TaxID=3420668 RepID=UPI003D369A40
MKNPPLTVQAVLKRKHFDCAKVIAGHKGLHRSVKWTHILEITDFDKFINGGELILTTGLGLQLEIDRQIAYVQNLIHHNAAALCIEIGHYFDYVPEQLIRIADEHAFPIIIFEKTVRFIDITQDLHAFIINQYQQTLTQLDSMSKIFMKLSLMPNGIMKILNVLHEHTNAHLFFIADESKNVYYPIEAKHSLLYMEQQCQNYDSTQSLKSIIKGKEHYIILPVNGLGQVWGYLCLHSKLPPNEYTLLNLERATMVIAHILLRNRMLQERQQSREDEFVLALIQGQDVDVKYYQNYIPVESRNLFYRVVVMQTSKNTALYSIEDWQEIQLQRAMIIRSILKKLGFFPTVSVRQHEIIIMAFYLAADYIKENSPSFDEFIRQISTHKSTLFEHMNLTIGISNVYQTIDSVSNCYKQATSTIQLQYLELTCSMYYKDLGVYRLLLQQDSQQLLQYVKDYLQEILIFDEKNSGELYQTLAIYLACNGAKNDAAEQLFIVRQTLYKRIERLENILGENFLQSPYRLNLEMAMKAYELLKKTAPNLLRF